MDTQVGTPPALPNPPPGAPAAAPRWAARVGIVLWLVLAILLVFGLLLLLFSARLRDESARLQADWVTARAALTNVPTPPPSVRELQETLQHAQAQATQIAALRPTFDAPRLDWGAVMTAIANYAPERITLLAVEHAGKTLTLTGTAISQDAAIAYARSLEQSNLFARVTLQSIQILPTPVFTPTPAPPSPTRQPFPDPRDPYEPDDTQPKPIAPNQLTLHSFYPPFDVDTAYWLAKAGRYYRVYTTDLAPGVDTFLTVRIGADVYINDDAKPGALASQVIFPNAGSDTDALIIVTNRGQFGLDKTYRLGVAEIIPTPTPFPTFTPTPTNTSTPTSTHTPAPISAWRSRRVLRPLALDGMAVRFVIVLETKGVLP